MNCKHGAIELIHQIIDTIHIIPQKDYARKMKVFNGSTLGQHFRHIYDFFTCLIQQSEKPELDYADRFRDPRIESEKEYAILQFTKLTMELSRLSEEFSIMVYADFELPDGVRPKVQTTIGRELMYAYDHAVHHMAIVKIGLNSLDPSLPVAENIGVAASTLKHKYEMNHGH